jgi:hypothetical protein
MKRIIRARLKTNYLSPAFYSDTYTLTKTPKTIENIFKYTPDVTENKKAVRFLQVGYAPTAVIQVGSLMLIQTKIGHLTSVSVC